MVGGRSSLELFPEDGRERYLLGSDLEAALDYIEAVRREKRVAVLLSGDPGFFSLLPRLRERFGAEALRVIPGISSLQLAFARLGMSWHDFCFVSVHGRDVGELAAACGRKRVAVLTGPQCPPAAVCKYFLEKGCCFDQVFVLTDLGLPGEEVTATTLEEGARLRGRGNSVVVLLAEKGRRCEGWDREWSQVVTPGLPEEAFLRSGVAMSQEEVRALVICKARLMRGMTVIEVGAGTGSWTVEAARLVAPGMVWAVEKDPSAAALVRANIERFGLDNVVLVEGEAPSACSGFPKADRVLIGGTGGRAEEVLKAAAGWLEPGGLLVLTAVTPETFSAAWSLLCCEDWEQREAVLVSIGRSEAHGRMHIWKGENPVFIVRAKRRGGCENA